MIPSETVSVSRSDSHCQNSARITLNKCRQNNIGQFNSSQQTRICTGHLVRGRRYARSTRGTRHWLQIVTELCIRMPGGKWMIWCVTSALSGKESCVVSKKYISSVASLSFQHLSMGPEFVEFRMCFSMRDQGVLPHDHVTFRNRPSFWGGSFGI